MNESGKKPEIFAYGLRNVWRFSFDEKTGRLWAGDVGQNDYEEINIIRNGGNYGWNIKEGFHTYEDSNASSIPLIDPVHEYAHDDGDQSGTGSVAGGYVYRGDRMDALKGKYVFGDYESGALWALDYDSDTGANRTVRIGTVPRISSFGVDRQDELYICSYEDDPEGRIYKLVPK